MRESFLGEAVEINVRFSYIDKLELVLLNETISTETMETSPDLRYIALSSNTPILETGMNTYSILGYLNSTLLFTTHRDFRYVPAHRDYLMIRQGVATEWDFTLNSYVGVYNFNSEPLRGWNVGNGTAIVDDGLEYTRNVDTSISFFIAIPELVDPEPGCVEGLE
jgi:hypothetical protein